MLGSQFTAQWARPTSRPPGGEVHAPRRRPARSAAASGQSLDGADIGRRARLSGRAASATLGCRQHSAARAVRRAPAGLPGPAGAPGPPALRAPNKPQAAAAAAPPAGRGARGPLNTRPTKGLRKQPAPAPRRPPPGAPPTRHPHPRRRPLRAARPPRSPPLADQGPTPPRAPAQALRTSRSAQPALNRPAQQQPQLEGPLHASLRPQRLRRAQPAARPAGRPAGLQAFRQPLAGS